MDIKKLTAPCGLACFACALYKNNITEELANQTAKMLGMEPDDVSCEGCRSENGCSIANRMTRGEGCLTKKCVERKNIHNCSECDEFPCEYLMPVADRANAVPHNTKLYNLSRIKLIGLEEWAKESVLIQKKYFKGKFAYGKDPIL